MTTTAGTDTRGFATQVQLAAELLHDFAELGPIRGVHVSQHEVAITPDVTLPFDGVKLVARWAQRGGVSVRILPLVASVTVKCVLEHRGQQIVLATHLDAPNAWNLAAALQNDLHHDDAATIEPDVLLAALEDGAPA